MGTVRLTMAQALAVPGGPAYRAGRPGGTALWRRLGDLRSRERGRRPHVRVAEFSDPGAYLRHPNSFPRTA